MTHKKLRIIGAGMAGAEAAWQVANAGIHVELIEMRPLKMTDAHHTDKCAEMVCSNSFRSDDAVYNAVGLLHQEMRACDSLIMRCADKHKLPAGTALAVDRDAFSEEVTKYITHHPNITLTHAVIDSLPSPDDMQAIIATGPLTDGALAQDIARVTGNENLAFFDAIAPIIYTESIDFSKAWFQSRYDKIGSIGNGKDYINCAMTKAEYDRFYDALLEAEKTDFKEWEKNTPYFEACLPIEIMASRGRETLRFGPLKPVGLTSPYMSERPYAVVQLRQDNATATLYNMVGFQTKLKYEAQKHVFRLIPALENAEFARLGGIHRNSFIKSPALLDKTLRLKSQNNIRFAGQITGCEGYVESSAVGLMAGRFAISELLEQEYSFPPETTALGALLSHITHTINSDSYQPMNINFGLFPPLSEDMQGKQKKLDKKKRLELMSNRARKDIKEFIK